MKILVITAFYPPHHGGGFGLRCREVVESLRAHGHRVQVLTNRCLVTDCWAHTNDYHILRLLDLKPTGRNAFQQIIFDRRELRRIEKIINEVQPDLLYLWHLQNLSDAILPFLAKQNLPIVYDEGGSELIYLTRLQKRGLYFYKNEQDGVIKRWLKQGIKAYARLFSGGRIIPDWAWPEQMSVYYNSQSALEHTREIRGPVEGAVIIPSGLDVSRFQFRARDKIGSPVRIVIPARIKQQKGCKDGILLVDELRNRIIPAKLLIIGEVQSEDYYNELVRLTKDLRLNDLVEIQTMVTQTELSKLYQDSDICFFSSYFKSGASRVPLEAMASGCLAITYGNEGTRETVISGVSGFLVKEGDIKAIADWMQKMMADPIIYQSLVNNARQYVEKNFSMDSYLNEIESFLEMSIINYRVL